MFDVNDYKHYSKDMFLNHGGGGCKEVIVNDIYTMDFCFGRLREHS